MRAAESGMTGPAVQFNIGVTAYRLAKYDQAEAAFREVANTPSMAALAYYNLGLVALRRSNSRSAASWFSRAQQGSEDPKLRELAARQLDALPPVPVRSWVGFASAAVGYDDNVALIADSDVLNVSGAEDTYVETQFALGAFLAQAWRLDGGLLYTDYLDLDEFDQLSAQGAASFRLFLGDWQNDLALQLSHSTLDGEGFENRRILSLRGTRQLNSEWRLSARYRYNDIDGMDEFSGIGGRSQEAMASLQRDLGSWNFAASYAFELSDHDDEALSALRHQLTAQVAVDLNALWNFSADALLQDSRYDSTDIDQETRLDLSLGITRVLSKRWLCTMQYSYSVNEGTYPEFDYTRNRFSASLEALF